MCKFLVFLLLVGPICSEKDSSSAIIDIIKTDIYILTEFLPLIVINF